MVPRQRSFLSSKAAIMLSLVTAGPAIVSGQSLVGELFEGLVAGGIDYMMGGNSGLLGGPRNAYGMNSMMGGGMNPMMGGMNPMMAGGMNPMMGGMMNNGGYGGMGMGMGRFLQAQYPVELLYPGGPKEFVGKNSGSPENAHGSIPNYYFPPEFFRALYANGLVPVPMKVDKRSLEEIYSALSAQKDEETTEWENDDEPEQNEVDEAQQSVEDVGKSTEEDPVEIAEDNDDGVPARQLHHKKYKKMQKVPLPAPYYPPPMAYIQPTIVQAPPVQRTYVQPIEVYHQPVYVHSAPQYAMPPQPVVYSTSVDSSYTCSYC